MADDLINEAREEGEVGRERDLAELRDIIRRRYPTPISAVEDYRKGYVTDQEIDLAFSQEEAEFIRKMKEDRDRIDAGESPADVDV
jgi:hypothetical protein